MANWSLPVLTSTYTNFVDEVKNRDTDAAVGFDPALVTPTNLVTNTIRWNSSASKWQKYNGSTWADLSATFAIAITGNAATATALETARTINGVSFNGSANINVNTVAAATFNNGGAGAASGTTFDGGTARTISYNTVGAPSTAGVNATGDWAINVTGTAANITGTAAIANGGTSATTAAAALVALGERTAATGALITPAGTTAQRPTGTTGYFRFNTTLGKPEVYNGSAWGSVGGGATGGGSDEIFIENGQSVTTNYSMASGRNAMSTGPITVAGGITVTIPTGSRWVIL